MGGTLLSTLCPSVEEKRSGHEHRTLNLPTAGPGSAQPSIVILDVFSSGFDIFRNMMSHTSAKLKHAREC